MFGVTELHHSLAFTFDSRLNCNPEQYTVMLRASVCCFAIMSLCYWRCCWRLSSRWVTLSLYWNPYTTAGITTIHAIALCSFINTCCQLHCYFVLGQGMHFYMLLKSLFDCTKVDWGRYALRSFYFICDFMVEN